VEFHNDYNTHFHFQIGPLFTEIYQIYKWASVVRTPVGIVAAVADIPIKIAAAISIGNKLLSPHTRQTMVDLSSSHMF
jgi:hypothetical protein